LLLDGFLFQLVFDGDEAELTLQGIALLSDHTHGLVHGQLARRLAGIQLGLQRLNFGVLFCSLGLQRMGQLGLGQLGCRLAAVARPLLFGLQLVGQLIALFAHRAQSLRHRQLARHLARVELGFQRLNLRVFGRRCFLQRIGDIGLGQSNRVALFPFGQLQPFVQLLLKIAIAHLLEDVGIPRLVDLEGFVAVGADDFVHGGKDSFC
jgi:hypothetical protein